MVRGASCPSPSSRRPHRRLKCVARTSVQPNAGEESTRHTVVLGQEQGGGHVASAATVPGCVSQGDTRAGALDNIREAIELYIDDCREAGDPVPTEAGTEFIEVEAAEVEAWNGAKLPIDLSGRDVRAALERYAFVFRPKREKSERG
jgi:predicted RNase H-like HicB family nuclease